MYVVLTKEANTVKRPFHDRRLVIWERDKLASSLKRDWPVSGVPPGSTALNNSSDRGQELIDSMALSPDRTRLLFD